MAGRPATASRQAILSVIATQDRHPAAVSTIREFLAVRGSETTVIWRAILMNRFAPMLLYYLQSEGLLGLVTSEEQEWLRNRAEAYGLRVGILRREALRFTERFESEGIRVLWTKGIWLSSLIYELPSMRYMQDIDLLVPKGDFPHARDIGVEMGLSLPHFDPHHALLMRRDAPELGPDQRLMLDLHHEILLPEDCRTCTETMWAGAEWAEVRGQRVRVPRPEVGFLICAIHMFKHMLEPRYRWAAVADSAALLRRTSDRFDWSWLEEQARDPVASVSLALLFRGWGESLRDERSRRLAASCETRVHQLGLTRKLAWIESISGRMPSVHSHDSWLVEYGRRGNLAANFLRLGRRLFSTDRLEDYSIRTRRERNRPWLQQFVGWIVALPRANWRFSLTSYLVGSVYHHIDQRGSRQSR